MGLNSTLSPDDLVEILKFEKENSENLGVLVTPVSLQIFIETILQYDPSQLPTLIFQITTSPLLNKKAQELKVPVENLSNIIQKSILDILNNPTTNNQRIPSRNSTKEHSINLNSQYFEEKGTAEIVAIILSLLEEPIPEYLEGLLIYKQNEIADLKTIFNYNDHILLLQEVALTTLQQQIQRIKSLLSELNKINDIEQLETLTRYVRREIADCRDSISMLPQGKQPKLENDDHSKIFNTIKNLFDILNEEDKFFIRAEIEMAYQLSKVKLRKLREHQTSNTSEAEANIHTQRTNPKTRTIQELQRAFDESN